MRTSLAFILGGSLFLAACGSTVEAPANGPRDDRKDAATTPARAFGPWEYYLDVAKDDVVSWQTNTSTTPVLPVLDLAGDEIQFHLPGFYLAEKIANGKTYTRVFVPGAPPLSQAGFPELPVVRGSFVVPPAFNGVVTVTEVNYIDIPLASPVLPSRGALDRGVAPDSVAYHEGPFYQGGDEFPKDELLASAPFTLRAVHGLPLQVQPFRVLAAQGVLRVFTDIRAKLGAGGALGAERAAGVESPDFAALYTNVFRNANSATRYQSIAEPGRMIIIATDALMSSVQPLADWKNQRGLKTEVVALSTVGTTAAAIKAYITTQFQAAGGLTYVILVGDSDTVPTLRGTYESAASDSTYAMVAGNDLYADLFVSRISARTATQVASQVAKFIAYEREPSPSATWYKSAIGIASAEGSPTDYERVEGLRSALEAYGFTDVAKIYDPGASLSQLISKINQGASIINYVGHGAGQQWVTSGFSSSDAAALTNTGKYPFVVDVSCVNGAFVDYDACLAESMLRAGTPTSPAGAIAMFSASTNASWVPPTVMQDHIIKDLVVAESTFTAGGLYYSGAMKALDQYGSGEGTKLVEQYNIFGDASLLVRTKTPKALTVTHATTIAAAGELPVTVVFAGGGAAKNTTVALSQGNRLLAVQTNSSGQMNLSYGGLANGTAQLTVTAFNAVPYIVQLPIQGSGNQPPVANAGADSTALPGAVVSLNGSASYDPEGQPLTITWSQTAGPTVTLSGASTLAPSFTVPALEELTTFTFQLVVNDGQYASPADAVNIGVLGQVSWDVSQVSTDTPVTIPDNNATGIQSTIAVTSSGTVQKAEVAIDITHTYIGDLTVTLDCPAGGSQVLHSKAGGSTDNIQQVFPITACTGAAGGSWVLRVIDTASQDIGTLNTWTLSLKTAGGPVNHPPVANAGAAQSVGAGQTVTLNGGASSDPDGDGLTFAWSQTGGTSVTLSSTTAAQPQFVAPSVTATATLTFSLVVSDGIATSAPAEVQIGVAPVTTVELVLVNEVMANPACVLDAVGEWLELYNPTAQSISLTGWILTDGVADRFVLPNLTIQAQGYLVLCRNGTATVNGNIPCNATYTGFVLSNTADKVILSKPDGTSKDQLQYGSAVGVSVPNGASMARHAGTPPTWSRSTAVIAGGCGDKGTPGSANP